ATGCGLAAAPHTPEHERLPAPAVFQRVRRNPAGLFTQKRIADSPGPVAGPLTACRALQACTAVLRVYLRFAIIAPPSKLRHKAPAATSGCAHTSDYRRHA